MKSMRFKKLLSAFLAAVFLVTAGVSPASAGTVHAAASQNSKAASTDAAGKIILTGLTISHLETPIPGDPLDGTASVTSLEGVTWDIPVIWMDAAGNIMSGNAKSGIVYYPVFVMYFPQGYTHAQSTEGRSYDLKLPAYALSLYGTAGPVSVSDLARGLTYVMPAPQTLDLAPHDAAKSSDFQRGLSDIGIASPAPPEERSSHHSNRSSSPIGTQDGTPALLPYLVRIHCTPEVISHFSAEILDEFVSVVRYKLIPQAVNLLQEKFPASFGSAAPDVDISSEIGLEIDYLDDMYYGYNTRSWSTTDPGNFKQKIILNYKTITELNRTLDQIFFLCSHEMIHAYMSDYTRYGMAASGLDRFPLWFREGTASCCESNFNNRVWFFRTLQVDSSNEAWAYKVDYDPVSVLDHYVNPRDYARLGSAIFDFGSPDAGTYTPYLSGYLATVYLSSLAAVEYTDHTSADLYDSSTNTYQMDVIRSGLDQILLKLHQNKSLDEIIREISNNVYASTQDFTDRFVKGTINENGTYSGDTDSLQFVTNYLNFLEDSTGYQPLGSILQQDQTPVCPFDPDTEATSDFFQVVDSRDPVLSTADPEIAWSTGGTSVQGSPSTYYIGAGTSGSPCEAACAPERSEETLDLAGDRSIESDEKDSGVQDVSGSYENEKNTDGMQDAQDSFENDKEKAKPEACASAESDIRAEAESDANAETGSDASSETSAGSNSNESSGTDGGADSGSDSGADADTEAGADT